MNRKNWNGKNYILLKRILREEYLQVYVWKWVLHLVGNLLRYWDNWGIIEFFWCFDSCGKLAKKIFGENIWWQIFDGACCDCCWKVAKKSAAAKRHKAQWLILLQLSHSLTDWGENPQMLIPSRPEWERQSWLKWIAGGEKEDFEVMPGSEMAPGGKDAGGQGGRDAGQGGRDAGGQGGSDAEGLADFLSLIARLGTQVMYLCLYLCLDLLTYTRTQTGNVFVFVFVFVLGLADVHMNTNTYMQTRTIIGRRAARRCRSPST